MNFGGNPKFYRFGKVKIPKTIGMQYRRRWARNFFSAKFFLKRLKIVLDISNLEVWIFKFVCCFSGRRWLVHPKRRKILFPPDLTLPRLLSSPSPSPGFSPHLFIGTDVISHRHASHGSSATRSCALTVLLQCFFSSLFCSPDFVSNVSHDWERLSHCGDAGYGPECRYEHSLVEHCVEPA